MTSKQDCKENGRTNCICNSIVSIPVSLRAEFGHPGELGATGKCSFSWSWAPATSLWVERKSSSLPLRRWLKIVNLIMFNRLSQELGSPPSQRDGKLQTLMHRSYGLCLLLMQSSFFWRWKEIMPKQF